MSLQIKEEEYCKLNVHYVAEESKVQEKRNEIIGKILKEKPHVRGFRPGKAPVSAIKLQYKSVIEKNLKEMLVSEAYDDIVFETKIKPIGYPQVNSSELHNNEFWCSLTILKKPEFELKQYKGFEIPKPHQEQTPDAIIESQLQKLRERFSDFEPYLDGDRVQEKDKVTMDVQLEVDSVIQPESQEGILYQVGQNSFPGLDENLIGMQAGEVKEFTVVLPETAPEHLRNKEAKFTVRVHMGMKVTPCPLDDSLAEKCGLKTYDELRNAVVGEVNRQLTSQERDKIVQQLASRLIEQHEFDVPEWLAKMEAQNIVKQMGSELERLTKEAQDNVLEQARKNVKFSLILDSIKEVEPELEFSDAEMIEILKNQLSGNGNADKMIADALKTGSLFGTIAALKTNLVIDWLVKNSKIVE